MPEQRNDETRLGSEQLRRLCTHRLLSAGVTAEDADALVDHMLTADLWDRRSHGLSTRLPYILELAEKGVGKANPEIAKDLGHLVVVDGDNGFGYPAGALCADLLIERVKRHTTAFVGLRNTRHTGMMGYYIDRAARANVVAMAFSDCSALVAPWGGARKLLGTNPLAFGFPANPDPVIVDMATSAVTYMGVRMAEAAGVALPPDCAVDGHGNPTTDPTEALRGAMLPFGEHRGGALALAVQILSGALLGAAAVPPGGTDYGLLLVGVEKGAFSSPEAYESAIQDLIRQYLGVPSRPAMQVKIPGWSRYDNLRRNLKEGVAVSTELAEILGL